MNYLLSWKYKHFFVRPATNIDIPQVKDLVFSVLNEYGLKPNESGKDKDLADIEKNYFSVGGFFGVAEDSNSKKIVGSFGLCPISKEVLELRKMYLAKPVRGQGLGRFMLGTAIAVAKEKKYRKIFLETISPLKEAIALYKQNGFIEIEPAEINDRVDRAFELELLKTTTK
jgi:putative acetyltransferase